MFKSLYVLSNGDATECLVYRLPHVGEVGVEKVRAEQELFGLICPEKKLYATHMVKHGDKEYEARQVVTVKNGHEGIDDVDPFDFRWSSGKLFFHS
jgi:hypothetical protein